MIEMIPQTSVDLVGEALRSHGAKVVEATPECVRFKHTVNGYDYAAGIRMNEDWCSVECDLGVPSGSGAAGQILFEALQWNQQLPGPARFAINEKSSLSVQAEFPLGSEVDLKAAIDGVLK